MSIDDLEVMVNRLSANSVSCGDWEKLSHFAKDLDCVVELGTNTGSTSVMLRAMAKRVITVDVFEHTELIENEAQRKMYENHFLANRQYYNTTKNRLSPLGVEVHCFLSYDFAKKMNSESIDMLFVDADHSYPGVKKDYNAWYPIVKMGGYFAFHDVGPGCEVFDFYNQELLKDSRIKLIEFPTVGPCWTEVFQKVA